MMGEKTSSLRGQVEQGAGFIGSPGGPPGAVSLDPAHLVNAVVTMQRLTDNGVFEDVTRDTARTDINGTFLVSARTADEEDLVAQARKGDLLYRTIVTRSVASDSTITVGPLNDETTVEAGIWAGVLAGSAAAVTSRISTGLFVNSTVASLLSADPSILDSAVPPLIGESVAHQSVLIAPGFGVGAATLAVVEVGRRDAAIALEERLDPASENNPATTAAWEAFFVAERTAYVTAGVSLFQLAVAREASAWELVRRAQGVRFDLRRALNEAAALQRARTTGGAVNGTLSNTGAPNATLMAIETSGLTLRFSLYGGISEQHIRNQFTAYGTSVRTALTAGFPTSAAAIQAAHEAIVAPGGARSVLVRRLAAARSAADVAAAFVSYAGAAEGAAGAILNESNLSEAARVPIARVLTMLAMAV
ncbi:MAG: hypothetical protein SGI90_03290 [Candidatus Eisenbacteria bacterium]|nr:hypothetical protein [Candidatus Eisenbacteria bacterium]